ncbi:hypothetical protein C8J57DRAFT_1479166 [Mycena rebaudengoi]|nr:hypothetical protein C8J57DRAFT_1479166 [Mycena rebaudengoi]
MADASHSEPVGYSNGIHAGEEFTSESTINDSEAGPYTGAFFPSSQNLVISGGVFTSNINQASPSLPSNFRMLPLGDIDLQKEIRVDNASGIIGRRRGQGFVRRMYSAKIDGRKSTMTVVLYQGDNAEDEWRDDTSKLSGLRHPNLVQIYGAANSCGVYATVIHDDLIPFDHFLNLHRDSSIITVYMLAFCYTEWQEARSYLNSVFVVDSWNATYWIRRASGRLCADFSPNNSGPGYYSVIPLSPDDLISLNRPIEEGTIISLLTLEQYHWTLYYHLSTESPSVSISPEETVKLGSVISWSASTGLDRLVEIAFLPEVDVDYRPAWSSVVVGVELVDGWSRYNSSQILSRNFKFNQTIYCSNNDSWLSQANHFFSCVQITSDHSDYGFVAEVRFEITIEETEQTPPEGYLFLCPRTNFKTGPNSFRWPACPAYWSLDPFGDERLSAEDAENQGFPSIELTSRMWGRSWDASIYAGLRQFHQDKGFDPDSQNVARHLGHKLFQVVSNHDLPFVYVEDTLCSEAEESGDEEFEGLTNEELNEPAHEKNDPNDEEFEVSTNKERDNPAHDKYAPDVEEAGVSFSLEDAEMALPSLIWKLLMIVKLSLMMFLASWWLHDFTLEDGPIGEKFRAFWGALKPQLYLQLLLKIGDLTPVNANPGQTPVAFEFFRPAPTALRRPAGEVGLPGFTSAYVCRPTFMSLSTTEECVARKYTFNPINGRTSPWTFTDPAAGNRWRVLAKGSRVVAFPMWLYCDDTSGNLSKKWNEHNSFLFTPAAPPLEMLDGILDQLEEAQEHRTWAWDSELAELVLVIPMVLSLLGDNPIQSEFACHIGLRGKYFCRACWVKGTDKDDDPIGGKDAPLPGETSDGEGQPSKRDLRRCVHNHHTKTKGGRGRKIKESLAQMIARANNFVKTKVKAMRTGSGIKDTSQLVFLEKLFDSYKGKTGKKQKEAALKATLDSLDPHTDTPVEILHVILLGFVKYLWRDLVQNQLKNNTEQKALLETRLNSFDVKGLGISPLARHTLVQYLGSLTGRDFRAIVQAAPFMVYDLVSKDCLATWVALSKLVPLIWQPKIEVHAETSSYRATCRVVDIIEDSGGEGRACLRARSASRCVDRGSASGRRWAEQAVLICFVFEHDGHRSCIYHRNFGASIKRKMLDFYKMCNRCIIS